MFSSVPQSLPVYLMGGFGQDFGQDTTVTDWINTIFQPIAEVAKKYYDLQAQQYGVQAQQVVKTTTLPSISGISPIYLIGGGLLIWYLLKGGGGIKGKRRKNPCRRRR